MKKFIAILLALTIITAFGVPAFATDEATPTDSTASEEEILEYIATEDFKENLEEEGVDVEEFEEKLGNGDYVIVEDEEDLKEILTDEQIEQIRKENALIPFEVVKENAVEGLMGLVMLPLVPVMLIVPVFGWVTAAAALVSPVMLITIPFQFIGACIESIDIYVNFDESIYRTVTDGIFN